MKWYPMMLIDTATRSLAYVNRYLIAMFVYPWKERGLSNRKRKLVFFQHGMVGSRVATFEHR